METPNPSSYLYAAYLKRLLKVQVKQIRMMASEIQKETISQIAEVTKTQKVFIALFDGLRKNIFIGSLIWWNKYRKPVILESDFDNFMPNYVHSLDSSYYDWIGKYW